MTGTRRRRGWGWPLGLVLALAVSAGANIAFMIVATRDASFAVEPDYYRKALEWDRVMAQEDRNRALGWSVALTAEAAGPGRLRLVARLRDRDGAPIDGAEMTVEAMHGARAADVVAARLRGEGGGVYGEALPLRRAGLWEVRLRAARGDDVFTRRIAVDLPGAG